MCWGGLEVRVEIVRCGRSGEWMALRLVVVVLRLVRRSYCDVLCRRDHLNEGFLRR